MMTCSKYSICKTQKSCAHAQQHEKILMWSDVWGKNTYCSETHKCPVNNKKVKCIETPKNIKITKIYSPKIDIKDKIRTQEQTFCINCNNEDCFTVKHIKASTRMRMEEI